MVYDPDAWVGLHARKKGDDVDTEAGRPVAIGSFCPFDCAGLLLIKKRDLLSGIVVSKTVAN